MHKQNGFEKYLNAGIQVVMYTMLPLVAFMIWVIAIPILLYGGMMTSIDDAQGMFQTVIVFSFPMILFFVIVPVILHIKNKVSLSELGLKLQKNKKNMILISINTLIVCYMFYQIATQINSFAELVPVIVQLCAIGISEEILCRGIINFKINQVINNKVISVICSSLIFAFLFHSGDADVNNLLIRFPLGLVLGSVRQYTGNVYNSILMHIWYNSWMFIL